MASIEPGPLCRTVNIYPIDPNDSASRFTISSWEEICCSDVWEHFPKRGKHGDNEKDVVKALQPFLEKLLAQASATEEIHWSPSNLTSTTKVVTDRNDLEADEMTLEDFLVKIGLDWKSTARYFFAEQGKAVKKEDLQMIFRFKIEYHATFGVPVGPHHTIDLKMNLQFPDI